MSISKGMTAGIGAAVLVGAAGVAAAFGFGGAEAGEPARSSLPPATATVTRATLTQTEKVTGTLSYGTATTVSARAGAAAGTLTWLAPIGSVVGRGQAVYNVDARPVVLLYGATPPYRRLAPGVTGGDVKQFEENLRALGYSGFTVDTEYTSSTATAVKAWQEALGLDETGAVDVSQVVVAAGELRVAEHKAAVGGSASGAILAYTGTTRVVQVALDVADQHLVKQGIAATVTLPDGKTVAGTVASIGTTATSSSSGTGPQAQTSTTIDVTVTVADQTAFGTLDAAPVEVTLVASRRQNVLTVPVAALVALAEGGYGVQVVEGSSTRYVAVTSGMFAGGRVEVTGVDEGVTVGVPR